MELTQDQYERIAPLLPVQRGNVSISNLQVLNAILYVAEHGCKWRGLPPRFGRWHTIYTRMNRWAKNGVLDRVFEHLQREQIVRVKLEAVSMDSTIVKVHPDGTGGFKKNGPQSIGKSRGGWTTKIHMVAADARTAMTFSLSPGQAHDAPEGRKLLHRLGVQQKDLSIVMDRAYEGQRDAPARIGVGVCSRCPPTLFPSRPMGIRQGDVQEAQ